MTLPNTSTRERTETQRVKRRMRVLSRRAEHLARVIADAAWWARLTPAVQHHTVAEHNALVWALGWMNRNMDAVMAEAVAYDRQAERIDYQQPENDHAPSV